MSHLLHLLGREHLDRLSQAAGGTRLFVPKHYGIPPTGGQDSAKRLDALLGPELAAIMVENFPCSVIYIPKARTAPTPDRTKLEKLMRSGLSARQIAIRMGGCFTQRSVEKMRQRERIILKTSGETAIERHVQRRTKGVVE